MKRRITIEDNCPCGAELSIEGEDKAFGPTYQHTEWLRCHRICRDAAAVDRPDVPVVQP